jgi:uncharacterized low-complexity protein
MNSKKLKNSAAIVTGTLLASTFSIEAQGVNTHLFEYDNLGSGAELRSELLQMNSERYKTFEMKCGDKKTEVSKKNKSSEAKCGEGKCGADKKAEAKKKDKATKSVEAKCGEGKCGSGDKKADSTKKKKEESKAAQSKCGQGKCGVE